MNLAKLLPLVLDGSEELVDVLVNGEKLNDVTVDAIQMLYGAIAVYGENWIENPENSLTKEALETAQNMIEDLAKEGSFPLLALVDVE